MESNQNFVEDGSVRSRLPVSTTAQVTSTDEEPHRSSSKKKRISLEIYHEMSTALLKCLNEDTLAADAKWNLFIAACQSYRYDSCLKPFPPSFYNSKHEKDLSSLLEAIDCIPSFFILKNLLKRPDDFKLSDNALKLLHWVLIHNREPYLKTIPRNEFDNILALVPSVLSAKKPDFIFRVKYGDHNTSNIKWQNYKRNYSTMFAYHGSRLENFHSIMHYGLQLSFSKTPLFGEGIYLSSELLVSLPYSSTGFGWGKSFLGGELSIVALCEILDHPSVHCQVKGKKDKDRNMASDSIGGEVPHKYYVVSNSEMIRVRYLLIYSRSPPNLQVVKRLQDDTFMGWVKEHKLLTCIMGYVFLLATVGLSNNPQVIRYYKMILNKAGLK